MFYIIEYNTDNRDRNVKIKKFKTLQKAKEFKQNFKVSYCFPDVANEGLPLRQQNWHRRFTTEILEAPKGFRLKNAATEYQERELRQYCEVVK